MTIINLIINAMSVFRIANMFYEEDGPYKLFEKIREFAGLFVYQTNTNVIRSVDEPDGTYNLLGNLLSCFWCTSIYIAGFVYILDKFKLGKSINIIMALSAISIIIKERVIG